MLLECDPRFFLYDRRKIIGADCQFFRHSFQPQAFQTVIFYISYCQQYQF